MVGHVPAWYEAAAQVAGSEPPPRLLSAVGFCPAAAIAAAGTTNVYVIAPPGTLAVAEAAIGHRGSAALAASKGGFDTSAVRAATSAAQRGLTGADGIGASGPQELRALATALAEAGAAALLASPAEALGGPVAMTRVVTHALVPTLASAIAAPGAAPSSGGASVLTLRELARPVVPSGSAAATTAPYEDAVWGFSGGAVPSLPRGPVPAAEPGWLSSVHDSGRGTSDWLPAGAFGTEEAVRAELTAALGHWAGEGGAWRAEAKEGRLPDVAMAERAVKWALDAARAAGSASACVWAAERLRGAADRVGRLEPKASRARQAARAERQLLSLADSLDDAVPRP